PHLSLFLLFPWYCRPRHLPSFPTRRSSDLGARARAGGGPARDAARPALLKVANMTRHETARPSIFTWSLIGPAILDAFRKLDPRDRKSTRLNSSHVKISYAVFCLKKKNQYT